MKNKLGQLKQTWTYQHKTLIVALALALVIIIQNNDWHLPNLQAETITYTKVETPIVDTSLEAKVEERAKELYKANINMDLERYRQEAIREMNHYLLEMTYESPYVDYKQLKDKYGY